MRGGVRSTDGRQRMPGPGPQAAHSDLSPSRPASKPATAATAQAAEAHPPIVVEAGLPHCNHLAVRHAVSQHLLRQQCQTSSSSGSSNRWISSRPWCSERCHAFVIAACHCQQHITLHATKRIARQGDAACVRSVGQDGQRRVSGLPGVLPCRYLALLGAPQTRRSVWGAPPLLSTAALQQWRAGRQAGGSLLREACGQLRQVEAAAGNTRDPRDLP